MVLFIFVRGILSYEALEVFDLRASMHVIRLSMTTEDDSYTSGVDAAGGWAGKCR